MLLASGLSGSSHVPASVSLLTLHLEIIQAGGKFHLPSSAPPPPSLSLEAFIASGTFLQNGGEGHAAVPNISLIADRKIKSALKGGRKGAVTRLGGLVSCS